MKTSEETKELFAALIAAQGDLPPVPKTGRNAHFNSKFAPLDEIVKVASPVMAKHGLGIVQGCEASDNGKMPVSTRLVHESGQWIEATCCVPVDNANPQGAMSAITYARRYGYGIIGLVTDDDDDGNEASRPAGKAPAKKAAGSRTPAKAATAAQSGEDVAEGTASAKQRKMIYAKGKSKDMADDQLKALMFATVGKTSTKALDFGDIDAMVKAIDGWSKSGPEPVPVGGEDDLPWGDEPEELPV